MLELITFIIITASRQQVCNTQYNPQTGYINSAAIQCVTVSRFRGNGKQTLYDTKSTAQWLMDIDHDQYIPVYSDLPNEPFEHVSTVTPYDAMNIIYNPCAPNYEPEC